jgi:hypothetical protein
MKKLNKKSEFYIEKKNSDIMKWLSLSDREIGELPKYILQYANENIEKLSKEDLLLIGYNSGNLQYRLRHIKSIVLLRHISSELKGKGSIPKEDLYKFINFYCKFDGLIDSSLLFMRQRFDRLDDLTKFNIIQDIKYGLVISHTPFEEIVYEKWEDHFK